MTGSRGWAKCPRLQNTHLDPGFMTCPPKHVRSPLLGADAVALLPPFARSMLALERPGLAAIPARAATWGMGKTLRWAFRQN